MKARDLEQQLFDAIKDLNNNAVKVLIAEGVNVNVDYHSFPGAWGTPLITAIARALPLTVSTLLDAGADINMPSTNSNMTPLMGACYNKNASEVVKLLLYRGADPLFGFSPWRSALYWASQPQKNRKTLKLLLPYYTTSYLKCFIVGVDSAPARAVALQEFRRRVRESIV